MSGRSFIKYLNPWKLRREREAGRVQALRARYGDNCARCRRPMRFDLPDGHDQRAAIELIAPPGAGSSETPESYRLCHRRCNASGMDHTGEVTERMRRRNEAVLLSKSRTKSKAA